MVDLAATPEPLAWLGPASPHSPIDKVLILPDQREYRELGQDIVRNRPAVNAFELFEANCPVSAPTVIRFGPPMFPADIPQVQPP